MKQGPEFLKTVLGDVKSCTKMLNERIDGILLEMDKGEEADYSRFKPSASPQVAGQVDAQAARQVEEEEAPNYHRSR